MIRLDRLADVMADVAHVERADEYNDKVLVRCHPDPLPAAARGREDRSAGIHPETIAVAAASGPAGAPTVRLARRPHPVCGHDLLSLPATPIEPQQPELGHVSRMEVQVSPPMGDAVGVGRPLCVADAERPE